MGENMNTKEFNEKRAEAWLKKFNADESRLYFMVGLKQNGALSFMADPGLNPSKIADKLESLARGVRERNSLNDVQ